jgi:hypothetical protein
MCPSSSSSSSSSSSPPLRQGLGEFFMVSCNLFFCLPKLSCLYGNATEEILGASRKENSKTIYYYGISVRLKVSAPRPIVINLVTVGLSWALSTNFDFGLIRLTIKQY